MTEHTAERDAGAVRAAVRRLADQAYHTAGNDEGRRRVIADRDTILRALSAYVTPPEGGRA